MADNKNEAQDQPLVNKERGASVDEALTSAPDWGSHKVHRVFFPHLRGRQKPG